MICLEVAVVDPFGKLTQRLILALIENEDVLSQDLHGVRFQVYDTESCQIQPLRERHATTVR